MRNRFTRYAPPTILAVLLLGFIATTSNGQCTLACNGQLNIGLGPSCNVEITYDLILQNPDACSPGGPSNYQVTVFNQQGTLPISTSPLVTTAHLGQVLPVEVLHVPSGNSCTGAVLVQDNLAPSILCPPDITVTCTQSIDLSETGYVLVNDCSNYLLNHFDVVTDLGCNDPQTLYTRTFVATDIYGNSNSCQQLIYVSLPEVSEVSFPPDLDNIALPALDCVDPDLDPANTGEPTIDGEPIISGTECSLSAIYSDEQVPFCEASYSVLRTWTVVEWCTGAIAQHTQLIKVEDSTGPVLDCLTDFSVSTTSSVECLADISLPGIGFSDDCSSQFDITIQTPFGIVEGNGGLLPGVPEGAHDLLYSVTDACGNTSTCEVTMTVYDGTAPTVICDALASVTLGPAGTAIVPADIFDDGSFDNCCLEGFSIRRPDQGCGESDEFLPTVLFCCEDTDSTVEVEVKVTDCAGNYNFCSATVLVNDQLTPTIVCPDDLTIQCTDNIHDLLLTGEPYVFDGCGIDTTYYADTYDLNDCNIGEVFRTWTTIDPYGNSGNCSQVITLTDTTEIQVVFPPDYATTGCAILEDLDPEDLPAPYDAPVVSGDNCELIATNYTDMVFTVAPPACLKIVRTWTLIDWCTYEANSGSTDGIWTGVQVIEVYDNEPPALSCPPDQTVEVLSDDCLTQVSLPEAIMDDCSEDATVSVVSDFGTGTGPFPGIGPGVYEAVYTATDGCGNSTSCSIAISVEDDKKPTPYCVNGLIVELDPIDVDGDMIPDDGEIEVFAHQFDAGSFDNCGGALIFSFSADPTDTSQFFDCDEIGPNSIELWVTDAAGNQDFCETIFFVQDNQFACNSGMAPSIAGVVSTEAGATVAGTTLSLSGGSQAPYETDSDGAYEFLDLEMGADYSVSPQKSGDWRNGVSTLDLVYIKRHILGIEFLDSPYKIIAADADRSKVVTTVDILHLQKLIMHLVDSLPNNNTSWRFVDAAYTFQDPANPLDEFFPELINLNNLMENKEDAHFTAIKVGDINANAAPELGDPEYAVRTHRDLHLEGEIITKADGNIRIPVRSQSAESLIGMQLSLDFSKSGLELIEIIPKKLSEADFLYGQPAPGVAVINFLSATGLLSESYEDLFELIFRPLVADPHVSALEVAKKEPISEAYNSDLEHLGIVLVLYQSEREKPVSADSRIVPNPFRQEAYWYLPEEVEGTVVWEVFDRAGQRLWQSQETLPAGQHYLRIARTELPGPGLYYLRLQNGDRVWRQRLLLID